MKNLKQFLIGLAITILLILGILLIELVIETIANFIATHFNGFTIYLLLVGLMAIIGYITIKEIEK